MKGFTSIKYVSASVLQGSPVLEGFLALPRDSAVGAVQGSLLGRDRGLCVIGPVAVAPVKTNKNIEIGH